MFLRMWNLVGWLERGRSEVEFEVSGRSLEIIGMKFGAWVGEFFRGTEPRNCHL